ncbi:hypothetical protein [Staphylococcus massiliensis]|uniref:Uncharacterized protein n=1 Tax=Staphylococcus massiliensis S46 TaxID=1229783 RepID=K9B2U7_9STAP|nr:hypothetical protein [Staphylococcus massiliensis]EKU48100.1 hypothetical protein C273_06558 [Staphylococcus massiliensis S46]MCG3399854.1 hypothetical protein [Staphylococcus massiliensis]MCG3401591.1 hypothetical protein [Staphylococcus massiliensis]MCG3412125.1 hypothetical protein [Staphylococcus massiliensis]PNZ98225.1 hypothetical protein CD133_09185 [Staphylococcus massiliensis CCUG 55927]
MRIYVTEIKIEEDSILCYTDKPTEGYEEGNQVLVDSDNYAFVALLDDGQAFSYLNFVQETWSMIHNHRGKRLIINDDLELKQFWDELDYLLENIEGNSNYGKDFVKEVEEAFELE